MAYESDIVNIQTNPVAYMAYQLNGLFAMNKVTHMIVASGLER
jgi:hypothetical protein